MATRLIMAQVPRWIPSSLFAQTGCLPLLSIIGSTFWVSLRGFGFRATPTRSAAGRGQSAGRTTKPIEATPIDDYLRQTLTSSYGRGHSFRYAAASYSRALDSCEQKSPKAHRTHLTLKTLTCSSSSASIAPRTGFPPRVSGAPSNANSGLLDQVAALHWISENVDSFGGSPRNVTLMGVKTGAIFVNLLMLSPLANGKFLLPRRPSGAIGTKYQVAKRRRRRPAGAESLALRESCRRKSKLFCSASSTY